MKGKNN